MPTTRACLAMVGAVSNGALRAWESGGAPCALWVERSAFMYVHRGGVRHGGGPLAERRRALHHARKPRCRAALQLVASAVVGAIKAKRRAA
ncbi:hypothetical protein FGB62_154g17 [Gracilaria domingensis]|nr:hypothetical protein FGB62_154g17 [Gracilaria domingensis]